ncbi:sugar porter family MFS transporter [Porticoccus sp. W117]|uniref:sugar porter family MFS transporter n=1 Tax=Porticoccus sp. W117 TaxID=3054777 RepID=UPI002597E788|nr:sugar porter family MFS transporter [Porticoccus sp. W117]MDM3870032.1 sugar porter family MFS transporter [Porticoccus sp. W117]
MNNDQNPEKKPADRTYSKSYAAYVALIVALGGFLMGFDASVISGVVRFIEPEFNLSKIELGWAVASLTLTATLGMMVSGLASDRWGRKTVLKYAALLFFISALASALANSFVTLVIARMIGGFGVGAALIIAPMYIAEIAPPKLRGRMVSFNQLNIVIGISTAFFTNYLILKLGQSESQLATTLNMGQWNWRWMLGIEALPAIVYFGLLFFVPESPRWLIMQKQEKKALGIFARIAGPEAASSIVETTRNSILSDTKPQKRSFSELLHPSLRLVMILGISIAILQQITGINAVFFYAPMIFEQSGIGTDASFMQAILVGLTNLAFTILAILLVDKLGRKPLLVWGLSGIAVFMCLLAYGFHTATYVLSEQAIQSLPEQIVHQVAHLNGVIHGDDISFKAAILQALGDELAKIHEPQLMALATQINSQLILIAILGFVASFAISIGPVMWVLFSELFPNRIRALAISLVGLINSAVSFLVQLVFPWKLAILGASITFLAYGVFAFIGLILIIKILPETKDKSLEELEKSLILKS